MTIVLCYLVASSIFVSIFAGLHAVLPRLENLFVRALDASDRRKAIAAERNAVAAHQGPAFAASLGGVSPN